MTHEMARGGLCGRPDGHNGQCASPEALKRARQRYRVSHQEHLATYQREYAKANRELIAARHRAHYEANKEDRLAYSRAHYAANRDRMLARRRAYYQENKESWRERAVANRERITARKRSPQEHEARVQRTYGLEPGEYARMKAFQGGKCAICQRATGRTRRLSVDHCHSTRAVRGLLCGPCNRTLGHFRDDQEVLARAIAYLINPPAEAALGRVPLVPRDSPAQLRRKAPAKAAA